MDRTFALQPEMDASFDSSPMNETWDSNRFITAASQLNATYSPGMDHTYSGTDHSFSSGGSYSPPRGLSPPAAASTPQRGPSQMNRTFTPPRGSPPRMDSSSSPPRFKQWKETTRSSELARNISDRTFSDRTYSGTDRSGSQGSSGFSSDDTGCFQQIQYILDAAPTFDSDESFEDEVFEEGDFPMLLEYGFDQGYGPTRDIIVDRGYYPAHMLANAADFSPQLFDSPPTHKLKGSPNEIIWRRPSPDTPEPNYFLDFDQPAYYAGYPAELRFPSPESDYGAKSSTPTPQPPPRAAARKFNLSPRTPLISQYSRFGYTDPRAPMLNIPPGDDLDVPSGIKKEVTIASPGRADPLHLNIEVSPKGISQSPSGEHIICDFAVAVEEAIKPRVVAGYSTPPMTETFRQYDRKHGMFTPRTVFKKGHYAVRNIFDVSPQTPSPRQPPLDTTIEWEQEYLNKLYGAGPSGAGLNTTFTRSPSPGLNRTFTTGPSGASLNTTFTKSPSAGLNRTFTTGPSGSSLNTTFTKPPSAGLNRTFTTGPPGASLNTTFTRSPSPGAHPLNSTFDFGPSVAGLNATFNRSPSPGLNRTFDFGPSGTGLNTTFTRSSSPGAQPLNSTFDFGPSDAGLNATFNPSEADGYQTPSYREPDYPVWTYPMRKKQVAPSPEQDLMTAVEDVGFDYYPSPPSSSPRRYYPGTN